MEKIIVPMPRSLVESIDEKKGDLSREDFVGICIYHTLGLTGNKESPYYFQDDDRKVFPWKGTFDSTWLAAYLSYGIGDSIATYLALSRTGTFADPVLAFLFRNNFYPVIPFKIVILLSALIISYSLLEKKVVSFIFPVVLLIFGILFIIINILYIIGI